MKKLKPKSRLAPGNAPQARPAAPATGSPAGIPLFLRSKAEASLGRSLDGVRLHTDSDAAESARSLGARAYTHGRDIAFAPGQYHPETPEGQRLIAHELAHVVQQSGSETAPAVGRPGDTFEQSADRAAGNVLAGTPAAVAPASGAPAIQREPDSGQQPAQARDQYETVDSFPTGSASLNDSQKARIADTAAAILAIRADHPSTSVTVTGHTDAVGGEAFNDALGQVRADAVKQELAAHGVPGETIHATSAGSHHLKVRTRSEEARNRRAEIHIHADAAPPKHEPEPRKPEIQQPAPPAPPPPPLLPLKSVLEKDTPVVPPISPGPVVAPTKPGKPLLDGVDKAMDAVLERLHIPAPLRPIVKSGAKAAATKAVMAPLDLAMDRAKLNDNEKSAVHSAFTAAITIVLP